MKKVVVVGLGNIAIRHRKNITKLFPNARVIAVSASGRIPEETISDADRVVASVSDAIDEKPDMAIVASPATLHAKHAIELIEAKIPVLIEKPLSDNLYDAESILTAAHANSTVSNVGYCLRYMPSIRELKKLIQTKVLGEIYNVYCETGQYLPSWRNNKDFRNSVSANKSLGGGALLELSHEIDYLQYLFGDLEPVAAILRSSKELSLEVEDQADILAINSKNQVVTIHLDFLQKKAYRKIRIIGKNGTVECDLITNKLTSNISGSEKVLYENKQYDRNEMYLEMLKDFLKSKSHKTNTSINLKEALRVINFIEKTKKIAKKHD